MGGLLEVSEAVRAEARIVTIRGELDLNDADRITAPLERAAKDPSLPLVIDLSGCGFVDSTGLATIIYGTRPMRDNGSGVILVCPQGEVRKLLQLSVLDLTFPIVDRLDEALAQPPAEG